jgi:hypothetical protein
VVGENTNHGLKKTKDNYENTTAMYSDWRAGLYREEGMAGRHPFFIFIFNSVL